MKLFTYTLRYDDGAAPNPFWGICTLAIRKPSIRRNAEIGDWVVGLGTAESPIGDISNHVVYAMKVTSKMTLEEYDQFCKIFVQKKKPDWRNRDYRLRMGDCIYNFISPGNLKMRTGIHKEENQEKDLSGIYSLVSKQFYYFGDKPVKLPDGLLSVLESGLEFSSVDNSPNANLFASWIEQLDVVPNKILGEPQLKKQYSLEKELQALCSMRDLSDDN